MCRAVHCGTALWRQSDQRERRVAVQKCEMEEHGWVGTSTITDENVNLVQIAPCGIMWLVGSPGTNVQCVWQGNHCAELIDHT